MKTASIEIINPANGEVQSIAAWQNSALSVSQNRDHFVITDGSKKFSVMPFQIFKTSQGAFFIRPTEQSLSLLHKGPFLSKLQFPRASQNGFVSWLSGSFSLLRQFKFSEIISLLLSMLRLLRYGALAALTLFLVSKNFSLNSVAIAPEGQRGGVLESALIFNFVSSALKNVREEVLTTEPEQKPRLMPQTAQVRTVPKPKLCQPRTPKLDTDVARFLPAATLASLSEGECHAR